MVILICPFTSSMANFSDLVKEFLSSSMYAPSPLSVVLSSTNTLWLLSHYVTARFLCALEVLLPLSFLCKVLIASL